MEWPKCEQCDGEGEYYYCEQVGMVKCEDCNGTGERELTADEAWEYLRANSGFKRMTSLIVMDGTVQLFEGCHDCQQFVWRDYDGDGETLTEALNAAARAAYRRQG